MNLTLIIICIIAFLVIAGLSAFLYLDNKWQKKILKKENPETHNIKPLNVGLKELKKLNSIVIFFLYCAMFRNLILIIISFTKLSFNPSINLYNIATSVIIIIILYNITNCKKWALISYFVFSFLNALIIPLFYESYIEELRSSLIIFTVLSGMISLLLCLKSNKISGWRVFYPKEEDNIGQQDVEQVSLSIVEDSTVVSTDSTTDEVFISSLPKNKNGEFDYDSFTPAQVYEYSRITEGEDVAIADVVATVADYDAKIKKAEEDLSKEVGNARSSARAKLKSLQAKRDVWSGLISKLSKF